MDNTVTAEDIIKEVFGTSVGWNSGNIYPATVKQVKKAMDMFAKANNQNEQTVNNELSFFCFMSDCKPEDKFMFEGEWLTLAQIYERYKKK